MDAKAHKKFSKDFNIPIPVFEEPYFSYFIHLYDDFFDTKKLFTGFSQDVAAMGGLDNYYTAYKEFSKQVIETVSTNDSFIKFKEDKYIEFDTPPAIENKRTSLYTENNVDRHYVSVDLVKANFHSLLNYDSSIFNGFSDFDNWICSFENGEKFLKQKKIRQIIFGSLCPEKQQLCQRIFMNHLMNHLLTTKFLYSEDGSLKPFFVLGNDEFLIDVTDVFDSGSDAYNSFLNDFSMEIDSFITNHNSAFKTKLTSFQLTKETCAKEFGFRRMFDDGTFDFKSVQLRYYPQLLKHIKQEEVEETDLLFYSDDSVLSMMLTTIKQKYGL